MRCLYIPLVRLAFCFLLSRIVLSLNDPRLACGVRVSPEKSALSSSCVCWGGLGNGQQACRGPSSGSFAARLFSSSSESGLRSSLFPALRTAYVRSARQMCAQKQEFADWLNGYFLSPKGAISDTTTQRVRLFSAKNIRSCRLFLPFHFGRGVFKNVCVLLEGF